MAKINRIKAALAGADKTNLWLAKKIGRDQVTISKCSTNTTQPDLQTLARIAEFLGIDIRELLVSTTNKIN